MSQTGKTDHECYPSHYLSDLLGRARVIAVVGASTDPSRPSFGIMRYLKRHGYRVIPVNPFERGHEFDGEPFRDALRDIAEPVDLVDIFRRRDALSGVVDEVIAARMPALWMQLGLRDDAAAARAEAAGIQVVMNRCISIEYARLMR